jgi:hypothetical protein
MSMALSAPSAKRCVIFPTTPAAAANHLKSFVPNAPPLRLQTRPLPSSNGCALLNQPRAPFSHASHPLRRSPSTSFSHSSRGSSKRHLSPPLGWLGETLWHSNPCIAMFLTCNPLLFTFGRWEASKPNVSAQPPIVTKCGPSPLQVRVMQRLICFRYKDLLKLHREAEDRLKAVEDVGVRIARTSLDALISSCERWSSRSRDTKQQARRIMTCPTGRWSSSATFVGRRGAVPAASGAGMRLWLCLQRLLKLGLSLMSCSNWGYMKRVAALGGSRLMLRWMPAVG